MLKRSAHGIEGKGTSSPSLCFLTKMPSKALHGRVIEIEPRSDLHRAVAGPG